MNFDECIRITQRIWKEIDPYELRDAVGVLDSGKNGYFTVEQLKRDLFLGESLDEAEFKELIKTVQVQADGTINVEGIDIFFILILVNNLPVT